MSNQDTPVTHQTTPETDADKLTSILRQLTQRQIEYVIMRVECETDKEAAEALRMSPNTVKQWNASGAKKLVDEAVRLMHYDGVITAMELRRRNLARAMAVKVAGLESRDERVRQSVATEIIEGMLGKAEQTNNVKATVNLIWTPHKPG